MSTYWSDVAVEEALAQSRGPTIVNDSKTPSGRAHVGALRGVLLHDALFRSAVVRDDRARYTFGSDDYDALDSLPLGLEDYYRPHLGRPLCDVPAPPDSGASDFAEHFIGEFFDLFHTLGVTAETYRMRDVYRSGQFDQAIDLALRNASVIRQAYLEASGSRKAENWYPLQVVCPACGKIATTIVTGYDGDLVTYTCAPALVDGAGGCGATGRMAPFGGAAKMPWKVEWAAKWAFRGVTIEGAGKDHSTKGGSRDVTRLVAERAFGGREPFDVPYEWFLTSGAKMSSSGGKGASAHDIVDVVGPTLLRFLVLRLEPNRAVNFGPERGAINVLVHDWKRLWSRVDLGSSSEAETRLRDLVEVRGDEGRHLAAAPTDFDTTVSLVAMPHLGDAEVFRALAGPAPSADAQAGTSELMRMAKAWLARYGSSEDRVDVLEDASSQWVDLRPAQHEFASLLRERLLGHDPETTSPDTLQSLMYEIARLVPLPAKEAFEAVYRSILGRPSGPRAASLLAALGLEELGRLLPGEHPSRRELWADTGLDYTQWRKDLDDKLRRGSTLKELVGSWDDAAGQPSGTGVVDALLVDQKDRPTVLRWLVDVPAGEAHETDRLSVFRAQVSELLAREPLLPVPERALRFDRP